MFQWTSQVKLMQSYQQQRRSYTIQLRSAQQQHATSAVILGHNEFYCEQYANGQRATTNKHGCQEQCCTQIVCNRNPLQSCIFLLVEWLNVALNALYRLWVTGIRWVLTHGKVASLPINNTSTGGHEPATKMFPKKRMGLGEKAMVKRG